MGEKGDGAPAAHNLPRHSHSPACGKRFYVKTAGSRGPWGGKKAKAKILLRQRPALKGVARIRKKGNLPPCETVARSIDGDGSLANPPWSGVESNEKGTRRE